MMMPSHCELHSGNLWWEEIDEPTFNMVMLTTSMVTKHRCGCVEISENEQLFESSDEWVPITGHVLSIVLLAEEITYGELKCGCRESYAANITEEFILSIQGDDDED